MTTFRLRAIATHELTEVRSTGRDLEGHVAEPFVDTGGGGQLRCCLRRSAPGERMLLIGHAPLAVDRPWREVGPVFVHEASCDGFGTTDSVPAWFDDEPRVVRAYDGSGVMVHDVNRVVEAGSGIAAALDAVFDDPRVTEAHVRNLLAQCFLAKAVRA